MAHKYRYPVFDTPTVERLNTLLDLLAEMCDVPSALVMLVHSDEIEVFASARTATTPYKIGDKEELNSGLYCEYVMANRHQLLVPNATIDPDWDANPDIKLGMISYLGYPLSWPDGKIFGTICILDNKPNAYSEQIQNIVNLFRDIVEDRLALLYEAQRSKAALNALEANREELSQAVRLAVDTTAGNAKIIKKASANLSAVLGDLVTLLELSPWSRRPFNESTLQGFGEQLQQITERITALSDDLSPPSDLRHGLLHKNRTH